MTTIGNLAEVYARLEEAVSRLADQATTPQEQFDQYEMLAIQILDSEHQDFTPGRLEEYLQVCLHKKSLELNLTDDIRQ
ncbi:hypothetical protein G8764_16770 [Pseudomaricurvus alcaniphilus]|uniref:hypothetical protein n=1 Tax=Pseudomaricurvus alcaniphilus TaxID=1166482 RepID=UPI00140A62F1|nr:hypothetical protein [Pseudomaricurvus alcaniphilus]NHN38964.1 hypothetical protein [Pseudomaricurvus alcaniphilus]